MGKSSLWSVPTDHFRTLYDNRTGRPDWWAILWGLAIALFLIVSDAGKWIGDDQMGPVLTGITVAATVHFLLVIGMCLKRLRRAYERIAMRRS